MFVVVWIVCYEAAHKRDWDKVDNILRSRVVLGGGQLHDHETGETFITIQIDL